MTRRGQVAQSSAVTRAARRAVALRERGAPGMLDQAAPACRFERASEPQRRSPGDRAAGCGPQGGHGARGCRRHPGQDRHAEPGRDEARLGDVRRAERRSRRRARIKRRRARRLRRGRRRIRGCRRRREAAPDQLAGRPLRLTPGQWTHSTPRLGDWLPFLDTYRTMCIAPEAGFRRVLQSIEHLAIAA